MVGVVILLLLFPAVHGADLLLESQVVLKVPVLGDPFGADALDVHREEAGLPAPAAHSVVAAGEVALELQPDGDLVADDEHVVVGRRTSAPPGRFEHAHVTRRTPGIRRQRPAAPTGAEAADPHSRPVDGCADRLVPKAVVMRVLASRRRRWHGGSRGSRRRSQRCCWAVRSSSRATGPWTGGPAARAA
jgi:hypothetical protein